MGASKNGKASATPTGDPIDVLIVGAGFGGLATALELAERGRRIELVESLGYPGGCASTFRRGGHAYESGATLSSGFDDGQLFRRWIDRHGLEVRLEPLDPVIEQRGPDGNLHLGSSRAELEQDFLGLPGAPVPGLRAYFAQSARVAQVLWELLEHPELLPPLTLNSALVHLRRLPRSRSLIPVLGKSLGQVLRRHGLADWAPLRRHLQALCQITVQCGVDEAEAAFAMATAEYPHRGVAHVSGGLGSLAHALVRGIEDCGGSVSMPNRIRSLRRTGSHWEAQSRRGTIRARAVVLNLLPRAALELLRSGDPSMDSESPVGARLARLDRRLDRAWGACMLYRRVIPPEGTSPGPRHLQLVGDPDRPLRDGNHVFCSITSEDESGPEGAPGRERSMTVSTHIQRRDFDGGDPIEIAARIDGIHERMRRTIQERAPEWSQQIVGEFSASPRTFQRFTGRPLGLVGGPPKRAGLGNWFNWSGQQPAKDLYLCGDTLFPGQSTLATALGGVRLAQRIDRRLG